jgi:hypothetical protein
MLVTVANCADAIRPIWQNPGCAGASVFDLPSDTTGKNDNGRVVSVRQTMNIFFFFYLI